MDELELQGKIYISSKRASQITGYAKDYVGQLARGNKLPATRVGRAWYVEKAALLAHAGEKGPVNTVGASDTPIEERVAEVARLYSLAQLKQQGMKKDPFSTWGSIHYLEDERDLFPQLVAKEVSEKVAIHKISTTPQNIASSSIRTRFVPSRVDGIALKKTCHSVKTLEEPLSVAKKHLSAKYSSKNIFMYSGLAFGVLLALVFVTSSKESIPVVSQNIAFSGSLDESTVLISEFFRGIFSGGIELLKSFLELLWGSLEIFFAEGVDFVLGLFVSQ